MVPLVSLSEVRSDAAARGMAFIPARMQLSTSGKIEFCIYNVNTANALPSNIQIRHTQRIVLNELPSRLDLVAHQPREQRVGVVGVGDFDLEE